MTKRVLSLLLALVMALSLCVPAFAAEAPVDEAEEVGAEVVDAPAEVAVDEPAEVAVDEPAAVDYLNEGVLQSVVDQANDMKPGIIAGAYQKKQGASWLPEFNDRTYTKDDAGIAQFFLAHLKNAEELLAKIEDMGGYEVWKDNAVGNPTLYQDTVDDMTEVLNFLMDTIRKGAGEQDADLKNWAAWYQSIIDENKSTSYGSGDYDYQPWFETWATEALDFLKGMTGYDKGTFATAKYKDYKTAKEMWQKLDQVATTAWHPEYTDYIELRDAIDTARNQIKSDDYFDNGEYPDKDPKIDFGSYDTLANYMDAMLDRATGKGETGFASDVTLKEVHSWLSTISKNVKENKHTLKINAYYITTDYKTVDVVIKWDGTTSWRSDYRNYHVEISSVSKKTFGAFNARGLANGTVGTSGAVGFSATPGDLGITSKDGKLQDGATITIKLICDKGGEVVDEKTIKVDHSYNGPEIVSADYDPDSITVTLNKSLAAANGVLPSSGEWDNNQYSSATLTLSYGGEVIDKVVFDKDHYVAYDAWTFNLKPVKIGEYTLELKVVQGKPSGGDNESITRSTETVTVPDITAYVGKAGTDTPWGLKGAYGYNMLLEAIKQGNNVTDMYAKSGDTAKLKEQLAANVAEAQKIVDAASTLPLSIANKAKVDAAIEAIYAILKNFEKAADTTALRDAIDAGKALVASDYDGAAEWKALQDAITAGENLLKKAPMADTATNKAAIADAAKAITSVITALETSHKVNPKTELAALKELIDSVPTRLAADDFSAESKAAVNAAVAAAKPLLDKTGVKKSEVNAAIDALQTALNNLTTVKSDAAPTAPSADYTGWATAENGDYYYFKNGSLVKADWVKSKGLWYHMGATGKMDTGFIHIVDSWGDAWYYLNPSNTKGTMGRMFTGWKMINDSSAGAWGWFETRNNGHQGQCTYTTNWGDFKNYKPF